MKKLLEIKNLTLTIAQKNICRDFNWTLHTGERWGILGPNGSGKTTFLHALAGLYAPQNGKISISSAASAEAGPGLQQPLQKRASMRLVFSSLKKKSLCCNPSPASAEMILISDFHKKCFAQKLGILLQDTQFTFPQTVLEYCLDARHPYRSFFGNSDAQDFTAAREAIDIMELHSFAEKSILTLSGGERRRLAIAALLTQSPEIYLLDEPANHLDLRHQLRLFSHIEKLSGMNHGIVMSLHDIASAQHYCDKILLFFPDGEIKQGVVSDIITKEHLSELYQIPTDKIELPTF